MRKRIITISGKLGSGKSSTAKKLASILKYKHFSSGDFLRQIADERGVNIKDLMVLAEEDHSIDIDIDNLLKSKKDENDLVVDSRLAFHWIPDSFKVYLDIDPDVASRRMFADMKVNNFRKKSEYAEDEHKMKQMMIERHQSDIKRYSNLYGINHTDHNNFDLVIDTGIEKHNLDTVIKIILKEYREWLSS